MKIKPITYTVRLQALINGRESAELEIDVKSLGSLQALLDSLTSAIENHKQTGPE